MRKQNVRFKKMHLKMASEKCWSYCLILNVLTLCFCSMLIGCHYVKQCSLTIREPLGSTSGWIFHEMLTFPSQMNSFSSVTKITWSYQSHTPFCPMFLPYSQVDYCYDAVQYNRIMFDSWEWHIYRNISYFQFTKDTPWFVLYLLVKLGLNQWEKTLHM